MHTFISSFSCLWNPTYGSYSLQWEPKAKGALSLKMQEPLPHHTKANISPQTYTVTGYEVTNCHFPTNIHL